MCVCVCVWVGGWCEVRGVRCIGLLLIGGHELRWREVRGDDTAARSLLGSEKPVVGNE